MLSLLRLAVLASLAPGCHLLLGWSSGTSAATDQAFAPDASPAELEATDRQLPGDVIQPDLELSADQPSVLLPRAAECWAASGVASSRTIKGAGTLLVVEVAARATSPIEAKDLVVVLNGKPVPLACSQLAAGLLSTAVFTAFDTSGLTPALDLSITAPSATSGLFVCATAWQTQKPAEGCSTQRSKGRAATGGGGSTLQVGLIALAPGAGPLTGAPGQISVGGDAAWIAEGAYSPAAMIEWSWPIVAESSMAVVGISP